MAESFLTAFYTLLHQVFTLHNIIHQVFAYSIICTQFDAKTEHFSTLGANFTRTRTLYVRHRLFSAVDISLQWMVANVCSLKQPRSEYKHRQWRSQNISHFWQNKIVNYPKHFCNNKKTRRNQFKVCNTRTINQPWKTGDIAKHGSGIPLSVGFYRTIRRAFLI